MKGTPYLVNGLTVTPIKPGPSPFGAEVAGVDWSLDHQPAEIINTLISLQDQYAVVIFRKTGLDNVRQVNFAAALGELEENPAWGGSERVGSRYLFDVSNLEADGSIVKKGTRRWAHSLGNALWHTDSSFNQRRAKYSMLLSHRVPGPGQGKTYFADTRRAWEDLPEERKKLLRDVVVEHDLWHSRRLASPDIYRAPTAEERALKPPAYHKLVQTCPSGKASRETLYIAAHAKTLFFPPSSSSSSEVINPRDDDSQTLIWDLIAHCTASETYVFEAEWLDAGDMMWWDNRQSMHRASPYEEGMGPRDVRRATVKDDGPGAFGVGKPEELVALEKRIENTVVGVRGMVVGEDGVVAAA